MSFIFLVVISLTFISAVPYLEGNKAVSPNVLYVGDSATITLTVNGAGNMDNVRVPMDVILVVDNSCSMGGCSGKLADAILSANAFINGLNSSLDRVGFVSFNSAPTVRNSLTNNFNFVKSNVNSLSVYGNTNIGAAIKRASEQFSTSTNTKVIVLISDGRANLPTNTNVGEYTLQEARNAAAKNITIYSLGVGEGFNQINSNLLSEIADAGNGLYWHYPTVSDPHTMNDIAGWMVDDVNDKEISNVAGKNVIITDVLAQGVELIGSSLPASCILSVGNKVICSAGSFNIGDVKSFNFDVRVFNSSLTHLNQIAYVNYTNYLGNNANFILNNPNVTILTNSTNLCVGNVPPVVTIVSPVGLYNNSWVTVRINAIDSNLANRWYNLNGTNVSYSGEFNVNLSNNTYQLYAYANDSCGSLSSAHVEFRVNTSSNSTNRTIGPNVTIVSPLFQTYSNSLILINITAVDDIAVDHIWCTLDSQSFNDCANSFILNLSNGYHTLFAYANDSNGNEGWSGVTFLVNYSKGNQTNATHVHNASCANTHAPVNDFDNNETADSISMDDPFVISLNYKNSTVDNGFDLESYLSGETNQLIFNMILLISIVVLLLLIVLIGKKR